VHIQHIVITLVKQNNK